MMDPKKVSKEDIDEIVYEYENKWYFWDETWINRIGPFDTKKQAEDKLKEYAKTNLGVDFI